jgi:hypothetical protein
VDIIFRKFLDNDTYIHTTHALSPYIGVAEASQIFLRDAHVLPKLLLAMNNTANATGGNPLAV